MIYTKNYVQISIRIRFPSEELNLWLYATDINGLSYLDNCSVLNIHILFMIGVLYRHRAISCSSSFQGFQSFLMLTDIKCTTN